MAGAVHCSMCTVVPGVSEGVCVCGGGGGISGMYVLLSCVSHFCVRWGVL